jgi:hypothetical protein
MTFRAGGRIQTDSGILILATKVAKGTPPGTTQYSSLEFTDSTGVWNDSWQNRRLGLVESCLYTDGSTRLLIASYQNAENSTKNAALYLDVSPEGVTSCSFPDTDRCDGQWVTKYLSVFSEVKDIGSGSFSISSYLPDSKYTYEIQASLYANDNGTTSGTDSHCAVGVKEDPWDNYGFSIRAQTEKSCTKATNAGVLIFEPSNRRVYYQIKDRALEGGLALYFWGYRRIGNNS